MSNIEVKVLGETIEKKEEEKEYGKYDKWDIQRAADTLIEAEAIKADKDKMKYVSICLKEKASGMKNVISSLDELNQVAKKKMKEDY